MASYVRGTLQADAFIGAPFPTQGTVYHVKPNSGNDGNDGLSLDAALATLSAALTKATAGQNDVILLYAESNSAGSTTARVTTASAATLDWSKDLVHLIGVNAGGPVAQRSRIAFQSTFATAVPLFTLSAAGCYIANVHFFAGVADANPTGCFLLSGERNRIFNCHIAGIGNNANDIAGAFSVSLTGSENIFEDCTIGLDTIARGTNANSGLLVDGSATRNEFRNCRFIAQVEHSTNHVHVRLADATAIDRYLLFKDCLFYYMSPNYATDATAIMNIPALTQGYIIVQNCMGLSDDPVNTTPKWDVNDNNRIALFNSPTPAADTAGIARAV